MAEKGNKRDENTIFIANKPFMNYVTGVVMQFTTKGAKEIVIKARGKFISRAIDVEEVVRKKFLKDQNIELKEIKVDSEELQTRKEEKLTFQ